MTNKQKGIIFLIFSVFSFDVMNVFVRLSGALPSIQKAFFRNFVAAIVILLFISRDKKNKPRLEKRHIPLLTLRSIIGSLAMIANYYAVDHLILSDAVVLQKIGPFCTIIFSAFILKEKPKFAQVGFIFIAFIGAALVANPSLNGGLIVDYLIALGGGAGAGLAYTLVRKISQDGCNKNVMIAFFSIFSCLFCLPFTLFDYHSMASMQWLYLLLAGLAACGGQIGVTYAYGYAAARDISVFEYFGVLFAALFSFFLFKEVPTVYAMIGYLLVVLAGVSVFIYSKRSKKII
jgi:drug/metabolite transporter (DMT)-like permease